MNTLIGLAALALAIWFLTKAVVNVPVAHQGVVERFGRCVRRVEPGLHLVLPLVEVVRPVDGRARELLLRSEPLICADDVIELMDGEIELMVTDALLACTAVADYETDLVRLVLTRLRDAAVRVSAEDLRFGTEQLGWELGHVLREDVAPWGVRVLRARFSLTETPAPPAESRRYRLAPPPL